MKKYTKYLVAFVIGLAGIFGIAHAMDVTYNASLANETGLAFNNTYSVDLNQTRIDNLSFQVIYGSMSPSSQSFGNGAASSATLTVVSITAITTATASDFLTVVATTGYSGSVVTVAGVPLTEGVHWGIDVTAATGTALSIKRAITTYVSNVNSSTGTLSGKAVVFATTTAAGLQMNTNTMAVNTGSITVNSATFTGGADNGCISVNGKMFCANSSFAVGTSSGATAGNIATAINNSSNTILVIASGIVTGLQAGVVFTTSTNVGTSSNYALFSSSQTALKWTAGAITSASNGSATTVMTGGRDSAVSLSASITLSTHSYTTGLSVVYSTNSGVALTPLTWGTTYFVIPVDTNSLKLATTLANAQAGTAITLTSSSTQITANTFTLAPLAIAGSSSYKWEVSNDGTNWTQLATNGLYTIGTVFVFPSTSTTVDFGTTNYRFYRINVTAPTAGGLKLKVVGNGKRFN